MMRQVASVDCFDRIPIGSILALLISWFGIGFYCHKMRQGLDALISIAEDIFANLVPFFEKMRTGLLWIAVIMAIITFLMAMVGMLATRQCRGTFRHHSKNGGHFCGELQPRSTGQRIRSSLGGYWACTLFMILNYLMYIGWIAIFAFTVALITVYYSFSPICLPQAGVVGSMCFNFTSFGMLLANGNPHAAVNLILCGHPVSQFCKLTSAFTPWYLSAFIGCFLILIGLNHFTACLAANFAHSRRAGQYLAIISRSSTPEDDANGSAPHSPSVSTDSDSSGLSRPEKSLTNSSSIEFGYKNPSKKDKGRKSLAPLNGMNMNIGTNPLKKPPAYTKNIYDNIDVYEKSPPRPKRPCPPPLPAKPKKPLPTPV